jgi:HEAT repeat protein
MATKKQTSAKEASTAGVAWAKLAHAGGPAKLVPVTLEGLSAADYTAVAPLRALEKAFLAPGKIFSASPPLFATLAALAAKLPNTRVRAGALQLLARVLVRDELPSYARGIDYDDAATKRRYAGADGAALIAAARDAAPSVVALLGDESPEVRAAALTLLALLPDVGEEAAHALVARLTQEELPAVRARAVFAIAQLSRRKSLAALADVLGATSDAAAPHVAGALRIVGLKPNALGEFFLACTRDDGGPPPLDRLALSFLAENEAGREAALVGCRDALAALPPRAPVRFRREWPTEILGWTFPTRKGAKRSYISDPLDFGALSDGERHVLEVLSSVSHDADYDERGMPPDLRSRRRLLGLSPASVMEDLIASARVADGLLPRWRVLADACDHWRGTKRTESLQAYVAKGWFELSTAGWLDLWTETRADAYASWSIVGYQLLPDAVEAASAAERGAWLASYSDEVRSGVDDRLRDRVGGALCHAFVRHGGGGPLPPELEPCFTLFGCGRELLAAMPEEQRHRLFTARFLEGTFGNGSLRVEVLAVVADLVVGCIPKLIEGLGVEQWKRILSDEASVAIAREAEKHPSLASALKALGV